MLGEGCCFSVSIDVPTHKSKSVKAGNSRLTKDQSTGIDLDTIPDFFIQYCLEID